MSKFGPALCVVLQTSKKFNESDIEADMAKTF